MFAKPDPQAQVRRRTDLTAPASLAPEVVYKHTYTHAYVLTLKALNSLGPEVQRPTPDEHPQDRSRHPRRQAGRVQDQEPHPAG
jgi:hypothetical protein